MLEAGDARCRLTWSDAAFPPDDGRRPDAAFVKRTFPATQLSSRREEFTVRSAELVVERAVVRGEDKNGVLIEPEFPDEIQDPANLTVHPRDHGRIRCTR